MGGRSRFQTKPDLLVKRGNKTVLVIDTKWKRIVADPEDPRHGVSQSDIYQMMAYGQLYTCPSLMLLYPHSAALGNEPFLRGYRIMGHAARLRLASVDLRLPRGEIEDRLLKFVAGMSDQVPFPPG